MNKEKERDLSAEVNALMESVKGGNAQQSVAILEEMIAQVKANSYYVGIPEGENLSTTKKRGTR